MPIELDEPRAAGLPVVKRTAIGQTFNGVVVKLESRDRLKKGDDGVMRPILKADGKAKQELVVTCLVLPGTTAPAGIGDVEAVPEPGDKVRLILKGKAFGDWIESKNALGRGVQVGDVVTQTTTTAQVYDANGDPSGEPLTTQEQINAVPRNRSVGVYGPLTLGPATDPAWTAKAEEAYYELKAPISAEPDTPAAPAQRQQERPF